MKCVAQNIGSGLLGFLVIAAISLALKGGPNYGLSTNVSGVYAGVLTSHPCGAPTPTPGPSTTPAPTGRCGANSIGVFSVTAPKSGGATGPLVIFLEGQAYTGTVTGTADPDRATLSALLSASFSYSTQVISSVETTTDPSTGKTTTKTSYTNQTYAASAAGQLNAKIGSRSTTFGLRNLRLKGSADVQFNLTVNSPFDEVWYDVVGFKQSSL